MIDTSKIATQNAAETVLELMRHFSADVKAADRYLGECTKRADRLEPHLKAFEYRPATYPAIGAGPLSGIPVGVKDIIATSDMPTTNGSPIYQGHVPTHDAWIVERLRNLGAIMFGKTVTTEFAWRHPGATVNPWNPKHTPGGSSSGSAAAVATGIVPLALGTQTVGSVIRPAAYNGIVGFKPSFGAIPRTGVHPCSSSLDHLGFFARAVDDVAYVLSLLAEQSDSDLHGRPLPGFQVDQAKGLTALEAPRLAAVRFSFWSEASESQKQIFEQTITRLRKAGAIVEDMELPELDASCISAINTILSCEAAQNFGGLIERYPDRTSAILKELTNAGKAHFACDYLAAKQMQTAFRDIFTQKISGFDAVLSLPALGEAPEGLSYTGDARYCAPWTLIGAPTITLPAGFGNKNLPLGVQLAGRYREDLQLLRVAKFVETVLAFGPRISDASGLA